MTVIDIATLETVPRRSSEKAAKRAFLLQDLDLVDSAILKALAITVICLHNFFHILSPARQNEFTFDPARFTVFLQTVQHPDLALQALFSFFGHFGVQIFVFLSAFGLAKAHWDEPESWSTFMWGRVRKLYPTFLLIVGGWAFAEAIVLGPLVLARQMGLHLVLMLLGISTLFGFGLPPVGPWWFIPFTVQFYAMWPLLRKLTRRFGWRILLALSIISLVLTWSVNPLLSRWGLNLLFTPIGRLPVLCMGVAAARYPIRIPGPLAALAFLVLLLGSHYECIWLLTMPAALLAIVWPYIKLRDGLRSLAWLQRLGGYSMLVFLLNAIVRNNFWGEFSTESMQMYARSPGWQLLFGIFCLVFSFAIAGVIHEWQLSAPRGRNAPSRDLHPEPHSSHALSFGACASRSRSQPLPAEQ